MSSTKVEISCSGFPLIATIVLAILKVTGIINVTWWWVFCPLWIPAAIVFAAVLVIFILVLIYAIISVFK